MRRPLVMRGSLLLYLLGCKLSLVSTVQIPLLVIATSFEVISSRTLKVPKRNRQLRVDARR